MALALEEARAAGACAEVPIGALVVRGDEVLARARNRVRAENDPTAHAELLALRAAARELGAVRLTDCEVYSTVEPCFMCAGALVNARIERLVFGAMDPKAGAVGSLGDVVREPRLNHRMEVAGGVLAAECGALLTQFFERLRRGGRVVECT